MITTLLTLIFVMLMLLLLSISFAFGAWYGYKCKKKKKIFPQQKPPTEKDLSEIKRAQKELENFMNYTGKPQEVING